MLIDGSSLSHALIIQLSSSWSCSVGPRPARCGAPAPRYVSETFKCLSSHDLCLVSAETTQVTPFHMEVLLPSPSPLPLLPPSRSPLGRGWEASLVRWESLLLVCQLRQGLLLRDRPSRREEFHQRAHTGPSAYVHTCVCTYIPDKLQVVHSVAVFERGQVCVHPTSPTHEAQSIAHFSLIPGLSSVK